MTEARNVDESPWALRWRRGLLRRIGARVSCGDSGERRRERSHLSAAAIPLLLAGIISGCATAPPPEEIRPVWPAPPETARIEFIRSIASDKDLGNDTTFNDKLAEFLSGRKAPANHVSEPMGLAVSDDGTRLYVADYGQLSVFVFDLAQRKFTRIGENPRVGSPTGIALDGQENVYVVDQEKKGISVFDRSGKSLQFITDPSLERPEGIAIDRARERIYLADAGHTRSKVHSVRIFDLQGKMLGVLGKGKGSQPGEFLFPTNVTVDAAGNVYVSDTLNSRVQVFDVDGRYVKSFGQRGNGWGMFDKPKGVAVDSFGNVYVVDGGWSNVQVFNQKGQVLIFFGGRGRNPGLLSNPSSIVIDKKNRIYVGDFLNHRVEVYQLVNTTATDSFLVAPVDDGKPGAGAKSTSNVRK